MEGFSSPSPRVTGTGTEASDGKNAFSKKTSSNNICEKSKREAKIPLFEFAVQVCVDLVRRLPLKSLAVDAWRRFKAQNNTSNASRGANVCEFEC